MDGELRRAAPKHGRDGRNSAAPAPPVCAAKAGAEALEVLSSVDAVRRLRRRWGADAGLIARLDGAVPAATALVHVRLEVRRPRVLAPHLRRRRCTTVDSVRSFIGDRSPSGASRRTTALRLPRDGRAAGGRARGGGGAVRFGGEGGRGVVPDDVGRVRRPQGGAARSSAATRAKAPSLSRLRDHRRRAAPRDDQRRAGEGAGARRTKALGTGVLFAAHMRGTAPGHAVAAALRGMVQLNEAAAGCLDRDTARRRAPTSPASLLGHLVEMAKASAAKCRVDLSEIPILPGAPFPTASPPASSRRSSPPTSG